MIFCADDIVQSDPKATALFVAVASAAAANSWTMVNGFSVARVYSSAAEEYEAATQSVAVADFGPVIRYTARGPDASRLLARVTTAPVANLEPGESARGLMLDERGHVVDVVETARLARDLYLLSASHRHARRLQLAARGFDAVVEEITGLVAALALIGPEARDAAAAAGVDAASDQLARQGRVRGVETSARPIHFGALPGVEVFAPREEALTIWERVRRARAPAPIGLDALEIIRIEGGAPRPGVDFISADLAQRALARRLPDEIGLAHLAPARRAWFNGRRALAGAARSGRALAVLAIDAETAPPGAAVFSGKTAVGRVTSSAFSPRLKRAVAFCDLAADALARPLEIALPGDERDRAAALPLETPESRLASAFRNAERAATDSRPARV